MNKAIEQAKKAIKTEDVPIGCIIVKNNKIISKSYNQKEKNNNAIKHAEILAIDKACKKLNNWHLEDCTLYSTTEPCVMCIGAIVQSRISKLVYAVENEKFGYSHFLNNETKIMNYNIEVTKGICRVEVENLLKNFFKNIRKQ